MGVVGAFSLKTETGTQEWDDDKKTTRRDSRNGTLQDDGIDSMLACWETVETSTLSWQIGPQGPP